MKYNFSNAINSSDKGSLGTSKALEWANPGQGGALRGVKGQRWDTVGWTWGKMQVVLFKAEEVRERKGQLLTAMPSGA